jgi:hypothetical protein
VTHLRKIMLEELERRNYTQATIRHYPSFVERFAKHFGKSPDKLGPDHLRSYQAYLLTELKLCPGSVENHVAALRFFFVRTLHRHEFREFLPYPKVPRKLPNILSLLHLYRKGLLNLRGPAAAFLDPAYFEQLIAKLGKKRWYVYAKPPFGGPEHVLRYLGRYTHRMAISNHRITAFDGERVSFRWRDYAHGGRPRVMTLDEVNFLCRFFLHVLPKGFVRIRRYGLLSNRFRKELLPLARTLLAEKGREPLLPPPLPDSAPWHCPRCGKAMRVVERFTAAQLYFAAFDTS